jgi:hypothetical protein
MILCTENGELVRGDLIKTSVVRSDMAPIPFTLEAEIRVLDGDGKALLATGKKIQCGGGDWLTIIKSVYAENGHSQGDYNMATVKLTALLDECHSISFARERPVIKESATLLQIYRACGATLKAIDADFPVPRFSCFSGDAPSFHLARALQELGGVVRWKNGRLRFFRLPDLFKQPPIMSLPNDTMEDTESGFLERHEIPAFFSVLPSGSIVMGDQNKARSKFFTPFKSKQELNNMSRCLVSKKVARVSFDMQISAGDLVSTPSENLVVLTAAHAYINGIDGGNTEQYTRLWLARMEG